MESSAVSVERIVEIDMVDNDHVVTRIFGSNDCRGMALLVCDLVRHIALMHNVPEESVWECVDEERYQPTTDVMQSH